MAISPQKWWITCLFGGFKANFQNLADLGPFSPFKMTKFQGQKYPWIHNWFFFTKSKAHLIAKKTTKSANGFAVWNFEVPTTRSILYRAVHIVLAWLHKFSSVWCFNFDPSLHLHFLHNFWMSQFLLCFRGAGWGAGRKCAWHCEHVFSLFLH